MPKNILEETDKYCPNCGQFAEGEPVCPNCGAILKSSEDELEGFHEDEEDMDDDDL